MNYFVTASERKTSRSTCYFEFQRGKFRNKLWKNTSVYLHADTFDRLKLYEVFSPALPHFDYYGVTEVKPEQYASLKSMALTQGNEITAIIEELDPWVQNCFLTEKVFTICGI